MSSRSNIVVLALVQVGLIVAGILGAGVTFRALGGEEATFAFPATTMMLIRYGMALLILPVIWMVAVLNLRLSSRVPEELKSAAFGSGFVVLLALLLLIGHAVVIPWWHVDWIGRRSTVDEVRLDIPLRT
jgi:hypothetical protein